MALKEAFYWHVPGGEKAGIWRGIFWNYAYLRRRTPFLTLTAPYFWKYILMDYRKGFRTCECGKTWWQYRLRPALVGDKQLIGGGC